MSAPGGRARLVLADGSVWEGESFGADAEQGGEVVFNTAMTGYQEILTDPSYAGQIVCMTYPEIGNVGVNPEDEESSGLYLRGFVVRDHVDFPSSWRSRESLHAYLVRHGVPGVSGIDTRALVRRIREAGAQGGFIAHGDAPVERLRERAAALPSMEGQNLVDEVTTAEAYEWREGDAWLPRSGGASSRRYRVVAYDFGIKRNILRRLTESGFDVTVVPARTSAEDVLALEPDGVFLSNGPGDPSAVPWAVETVRALVGRKPIFGICLGHQILGLALGGTRTKLRFGHHGANQPAHERDTGRVMIASENHGFALDAEALAARDDLEVTHVNLNDGCVEGLRHRELPVFSVQFHPEASPGPHDTSYLFDHFHSLIEADRAEA
ncbi:MAG: glutamine-hydrolyzing carbamoyl-phosphate synthase small subunit [Deltaproteobacteria bacterium]|nr:glutamine-hydrolyzing carbamoyl-phosphate synthase small subunit [Deltaproteobacteria bacterium]